MLEAHADARHRGVRNPLRLSFSVTAILALGSLAAAQFTVPGNFPDPQTALNSLPPGATIVINGGTWPGVTITKEVTLVGDPAPTFQPMTQAVAGIELLGSGTGKVVLANVHTSNFLSPTFYSSVGPGIRGGGFEQLNVIDCTIDAAAFGGLASGLAPGASGIDTSVPLLWIERSIVRASKTLIDETPLVGALPGADAVVSSGQVVVQDSMIFGGDNDLYYYNDTQCPTSCPPGDGGLAVVCVDLYWSNSTFVPGAGAVWYSQLGVFCCQVPPRYPISANTETELVPGLDPATSPQVGGMFQLTWSTPSSTAWLILSPRITLPQTYPFGVWCLGPFSLAQTRVVASPGSYSVKLPNSSSIVGTHFGFQVYDPAIGLTRPAIIVVRP